LKLPADVRPLLERRFQSKHREWLAAPPESANWPLAVPLGLPSEADALLQPQAVRAWADAWRQWRGAGQVRWSERRWRVLGTQTLPEQLILDGPMQVAAWAGEAERWRRAVDRFQLVVARWPALAQRLTHLYGVLADYVDADFGRLLDLARWLQAHPHSGLYPRQLPLAGMDSKWLDARRAVVAELMGVIHGNAAGEGDIYAICGLKRPPALVRIRLLDAGLRARAGGLGDITAPATDLAQLDLPAATVLIVENLQTGLALDDLPGTVAIMALGYGVDTLASLPWVHAASALYWGDIDTHGFAILHRVRGILPHIASVLMDETTLQRFAPLWSDEKIQHAAQQLERLNPAESALYASLKQQRWGQNVRLEQERIAWDTAWPVLQAFAQADLRG
jgi:hypothetical protein